MSTFDYFMEDIPRNLHETSDSEEDDWLIIYFIHEIFANLLHLTTEDTKQN